MSRHKKQRPEPKTAPPATGVSDVIPRDRWPTIGLAALLVVLALVAYAPSLRGGFVWDDDAYVTKNDAVQSPGGLGRIWFDLAATPQYYPLVFTTFWIEHRLWDNNPVGYHLLNILLHAGVAVLLWRVLANLQLPGAWLAAAIFAVHPVHVESVAWITERKNVLSGVFVLGSVLAWMRFAGLARRGTGILPVQTTGWKPVPDQWRSYAICLALFAAALLSKTSVSPLPLALLVLIWWKRGRVRAGDVLAVVPLLVMAVGSAAITVYVEHKYTAHQGEGGDWPYTLVERGLIAGRALWFYATKVVWPVPITFVYPRWQVSQAIWWQYLFPATAVAAVIALWATRNRWGRGPLAAVMIFGLMAVPVLGLIDVYYMRYSLVADHFQYLPSMAIIALVAAALTWAGRRWGTHAPAIPYALAAVVLAALIAKSWHDCGKWHDIKTLWNDTLADNHDAWIAHNNLGATLKDEAEYADAQGAKLESQGLHAESVAEIKRARHLRENAIAHLREALQRKPDHANAHFNLATALIDGQDFGEAADHLRTVLSYLPNNGQSHLNLANILAAGRQFDEARAHYLRAIQLMPKEANPRYNYALMLIDEKRLDEARAQLEAALAIQPNFREARNVLAQLVASRPT